ncbi:SDR family NAD(P)-dependent oxidoreductase [Bacillus alkalicellulosilyticus]|uniref:SDR family NAD(P)-dependent oxidoreductase n=1 Tax=Alkalihalobacterium alkalicellulosilyticum TaxID=1912214 RepID=UPI000996A05B|nr:SDR family oxidoreductase [Bacillus alkalicellulosilyticus]
MLSLIDKHVVITGASSGLGKEIAIEVAKRGGIPIMLARSEDKLIELQGIIQEKFGVTAYTYMLNVTEMEAVQDVFSLIISVHGHIDILVNNAGMAIFDEFSEAALADMKNMIDVNVVGLLACTRAVLPSMIARNKGHIINIASQAGKIGTPKSSVYAATKHAVLGFTNSLRMEMHRYEIEVSAVNPGPIKTPFFDLADQSGSYVKNVENMMLDPQKVAGKIVNMIEKPRRELNLPWWMNIASRMYQIMPSVVEKIGGKKFYQK